VLNNPVKIDVRALNTRQLVRSIVTEVLIRYKIDYIKLYIWSIHSLNLFVECLFQLCYRSARKNTFEGGPIEHTRAIKYTRVHDDVTKYI
jgi:hypothetical protein